MAVLARTLAFYPETNSRVQACVDRCARTFQQALDARPQRGDDELALVFTREELAVDTDRHDLVQGSNLHWLAERFDACGLSGVGIQPPFSGESMIAYCKQLLDAYRRSALDIEFEEVIASPPPGMRQLPRRFEGTFEDTGEEDDEDLRAHVAMDEQALKHREDQLAARLLRDGRVLDRLEQLAHEVSTLEGSGRTISAIELLSRIVRVLPFEAVRDADVAVERTLEMLDMIDVEWVRNEASEDHFGKALLSAGLQLFGRRNALLSALGIEPAEPDEPAEEQAASEDPGEVGEPARKRVLVSSAARGHTLDDTIGDDLDALIEEIALLPPASGSDLKLLRAELPAEEIGVFLHYLVTLESREVAELVHPPLVALLRTAGHEERQVVGQYVQVMNPNTPQPAGERHRRRLLDFLHAYGMTRLLAEYGAFTDDMALELFPEDFGLYLDSLDLKQPAEHAELARLLAQLGPERILESASQLVREARILEPLRVRQLLSRPDTAMAPIARIALARGETLLKATVAAYVRSVAPESEETCLLQILSDEELPRDYLADLIDPPQTAAARDHMHERISESLSDFIESIPPERAEDARRLAAIRLLALFQTPRATRLLRRLAHGRRMLLMPAEPSEVRIAARASLACHV